jgi:hypothetical protein
VVWIDICAANRNFRGVSGERGETVDLAYIGRGLQRLSTEVASLRDDMKVLTAIVLRHEETVIRVLEQITTMVGQNARTVDRLRAVEDRSMRSKIAGNRTGPGLGGVCAGIASAFSEPAVQRDYLSRQNNNATRN